MMSLDSTKQIQSSVSVANLALLSLSVPCSPHHMLSPVPKFLQKDLLITSSIIVLISLVDAQNCRRATYTEVVYCSV